MRYEIPVKIVSVANAREHWGARARRAKIHRQAAFFCTPAGVHPPCTIHIIRVAPTSYGTLDTDNLANACKGVRDGIADRMKIDDADPRVTWSYGQKVGKVGVEVEVST
jgi:hypothetical protein